MFKWATFREILLPSSGQYCNIKYEFTKLLWLQIESKIHLENKSNVQKESNASEGIKGIESVKWKQ